MVQPNDSHPTHALLTSLDPTMAETLSAANRVAPTNTTVLISGETGTGKEVLARYIHACSPRRRRAFVAVNCGALPEHLIESELFGHERGAFSGATERRVGHIQSAHRGTLVLDEISELPLSQQTRLLRVLQEREIQRIGSSQPEPVDVRVIATTNRSLPAMVQQGRFRRDLFFRLHVFPVHLPPLRARLADLPALVATLLAQLTDRDVEVTPAAMTALRAQRFAGNIRELRNLLERGLVLAGNGPITPGHVAIPDWDETIPAPRRRPPTDRLADREREAILQILVECDGNRTKASRRLGISVRTLRNRLRDYRFEGIAVPKPGGGL